MKIRRTKLKILRNEERFNFFISAWRSVLATSKLKAGLLTCDKAGALLLTRRSLETAPSEVPVLNIQLNMQTI
jgi:hypothetical protein